MDKRNDKPSEKKAFEKKSGSWEGKKPFEKKTFGSHRFEGKPRCDKPFEKKPYEGKPRGDKPFEKKPYEGKPRGDKPFEKKPFESRARSDKPFEKKPFESRARSDKPFEKKPYEDKPRGDRPFGKKPFEGRPRAEGSAENQQRVQVKTGMSARRVALNALIDVNRMDAYASLALDKRLRESSLSADDRRLATSIFYAAIENKLNIEYVLGAFLNAKPDAIIEDILHIACAQILFMDKIPPHAAVDEAVKLARAYGKDEATGFVNGVLRNLLRAREAGEIGYPDEEAEPLRYLSVKYSIPEVILNRLVEAYGMEMTAKIAAYRPQERLETVRPNWMKMDEEAFEAYLTRRRWDWRRGTVPGAYLVSHAGNLAGDPDFYDGVFSVQGESSMLCARAVEARPGMTIVDACAAPGGKSAMMCEMMRGTGRVHAWDVHSHRVELLKAMGKRLKLDNLRPAIRDASVNREELNGAIDAVLVDAPCSGIGVMTDKPDLKYRVTNESICSLVETQKKILKACAPYVKRGGLLVYSTCSILPEENEKQIESFLFDHPEFKLDADSRWVPDALKAQFKGGVMSLIPARDGVEGFFIARMRRVDV